MAANQMESLSEIFNGKFLRIPDYQRGYAWKDEQLSDFWEDLENLEDKHTHYTGVLTLEKVNEHKKQEKIEFWKQDAGAYESDQAYYIVDGQQRITTCVILIKVLLETVEGEEWFAGDEPKDLLKKYISKQTQHGTNQYFFGYTSDNPSYEYLKTSIFGDSSSSNDNKETLYTANLEYAKEFFAKKIANLSFEEKQSIFTRLTGYFKFNVYEITDDLDVFVAFETMNNRGKSLSNLELLKNRLIYLSTKFHDDDPEDKEKANEALRTDINNCWKTVYEYLGKNKKNPLPDDVFLKNHWIMYHDYSRQKGNDYIIDLLKERYITKKITTGNANENLSREKIREYVLSLQDSVKHWYYLHNPSEAKYDDSIKLLLDKLYRLGHGAFAPLLMAILSSKNDYKVDEFCKLLSLMERYIFLVFKVAQRRSNTGDSEFYGYARKYYEGKMNIEQIVHGIPEGNDKCSGVNKWLKDYFDFKNFEIYMLDKFKYGEGYYSWNGLSYFLFEYELYLRKKSANSEQKIDWSSYTKVKDDHRTIEHIFPQTPTEDCWKEQLSDYNDLEKKKLVNSLGNLVPLSKSKNSKLRNYCFKIKKEGKEGKDEGFTGFKNGSHAEQKINEYPIWTQKEIDKRGKELISFLIEHWCIADISEGKDLEDIKEKLLFKVSKSTEQQG